MLYNIKVPAFRFIQGLGKKYLYLFFERKILAKKKYPTTLTETSVRGVEKCE